MDDLLLASDTDLLAYTGEAGAISGRSAFLLRAACDAVRDYCGWHIAPSVTQTVPKLPIGSQGIVMLPSLYVTAVSSVVVDDTVLDPAGYEWFQQGFIETRSPVYRYGFTGFSGGGSALATVTMTHGYTTCPTALKAVIFEMMETADETPAENVQSVNAPDGYSITWGDNRGLTIGPNQMGTLNKYRIGGVK